MSPSPLQRNQASTMLRTFAHRTHTRTLFGVTPVMPEIPDRKPVDRGEERFQDKMGLILFLSGDGDEM